MSSGNPTVTTKLLAEDESFSAGLDAAEKRLAGLSDESSSAADKVETLSDAFIDADSSADGFGDKMDFLDSAMGKLDRKAAGLSKQLQSLGVTARTAGLAGGLLAAGKIYADLLAKSREHVQSLEEGGEAWKTVGTFSADYKENLVEQHDTLVDMFKFVSGIAALQDGLSKMFENTSPVQFAAIDEGPAEAAFESAEKMIQALEDQLNPLTEADKVWRQINEQLEKYGDALTEQHRAQLIDLGRQIKQREIAEAHADLAEEQAEREKKRAEARQKQLAEEQRALEKQRKEMERIAKQAERAAEMRQRAFARQAEAINRAAQRVDDVEFARQQFFERDRGFRSESFNDPAALANRLQGSLFNRADNARQQQLERLDRRLRQAQEHHREQQEAMRELIRKQGTPIIAGFI